MATISQLEPLCPKEEHISSYLECVQLFFTANKVKPGRQVPALLSAIGEKVYNLLSDLLVLGKPTDKPLQELTPVLKSHYEPKPPHCQAFLFLSQN